MEAESKSANLRRPGDTGFIVRQQQVEAALRASEGRFHSLLENIPSVAVQGYGMDGTTQYWNHASELLYGYSAEEALGQSLLELIIPPEMRAGVQRAMAQMAQTKEPIPPAELSLMRKDGSRVAVFSSHAILQLPGREVELFCIDIDLTEHKRTEAALRASEERHRTILQTAMDGFWLTDTAGHILESNASYGRMSGYSLEELVGRSMAELEAAGAEATIGARLEQIQQQGEARFESQHRRKDGSLVEVEACVQYQAMDGGRLVCFFRDITYRKRMEAVQFFLAQTSGGTKEEPFFHLLAEFLARVMGMDFVCIDRLDGDGLNAQTLAVWHDGKFEDNLTYALKDTPCGEVVGKTVCCFPASVGQFFPRDQVLQELRAESYVGVTLWNHDGLPIGLIAVIGRKPLVNRPLAEATLKVVAGRAGGELERLEAEAARQQADEEHRRTEARQAKMVANIGDVIVIIDQDGINRYKSPNVEKRLGWRPEDLLGTSALVNVHPEDLAAAQAFMAALFSKPDATGTLECRYRCKDGSYRWIEFTGVNLLHDPEIRGVLGNYHDITARKEAEATLQKSQELFELLMQHSPIYLYIKEVTDTESRVLLASDNFQEMTGVRGRNMQGKTMAELFPPEFAAQILADDQSVVTSGQVLKRDESLNGRSYTTIKFPVVQGDKTLLAGFTIDITERQEAEAALRREQRFAQALLDSLPAIFYLYSYPECRLVLWNKQHEALMGYSADELKGFHVTDWHRGEAKAAVLAAIETLMKTGSISIEAPLWTKAGQPIPFVLTGVPFESQGKTYFMGIGLDITERKLAEEAHTRLATVVEQASEIIVITDTGGTIIYVNPSFEKITGYSRAEAIGQNPRILKSDKQDGEFYRQLWATLKRGEVWRGHFINRRKDGSLFEEEATISPVRDAKGSIANYVAVKRDVTREVQLEAQLRQSQKMEAIGQLAGGVAHDFNNILASMIMQTELVSMAEALPEEALEGLKQIRADANRAADLTRQLLLFGRRQVMQPQDLDLNGMVINLTKMVQRIIGEDIRLQLHLHPVALLIHADPGMIDQVLMNLTVNARDAMPKGGCLRVETSDLKVDEGVVRQHPDARPGHYACLSVSDTGSGIPPEIMPQIFDPFFTTKDVGKGTGLGLATVFGIVKQHLGWIKVDNHPGEGVTFQIFLPTTITTTAAAADAPAPNSKAFRGTETILLVEDEARVRAPLITVLKRHGYQVLEAANGVEALAHWEQHQGTIAMLLTDLVMPADVSGLELARQLQAKQPALKVIFMSGYSADIAGRELALRPGENFLQKPFNPIQLLETIRRCLDAGTG